METIRVAGRHRRFVLPVLVGMFLAIPAMAVADHFFSDVADDSTHAEGIHYVAEAGITTGCTATTYCPGANLTRGQMATFLFRASGNAPGVEPSVNAATISSDAVVTVQSSNSVTNASSNSHSVACPAGTVVVGGGGFTSSTQWRMEDSRPVGASTWQVLYRNTGAASNQSTTVYARCLRVGP
jgi:hypothetical protein